MGDQTPPDAALGAPDESPLQGRPRELEDWLNFYIYHPLSARLARILVPTSVTPDMVSIMGGLMIVLAAVIYGSAMSPLAILAGLVVHMSWHVFDGADGDLARLTDRASDRGEVIDGICDYVGHIILYVTLGVLLSAEMGPIVWAFAISAGAGRIVQAAHYEVQRRQYQHWVYGRPMLRTSVAEPQGSRGLFGWIATGYVLLSDCLAPKARQIDAVVESIDPGHRPALRTLIKRETVPVLRSTYLLSANYRTIVLGIAMLAGSPIYFFVFEAVLLTAVLLVSIATANHAAGRILDQASSLR